MNNDERVRAEWKTIRFVFRKSFLSSFHYSVCSLSPEGTPHATPIGSLILHDQETKGFYFEVFTSQLKANVEKNPNLCVLAVQSGFWFWLRSLWRGKFVSIPAVRLYGVAGERRKATGAEVKRWQRRVGPLRRFKGYQLLWGNLLYVRDIQFRRHEWVEMGTMTSGLV